MIPVLLIRHASASETAISIGGPDSIARSGTAQYSSSGAGGLVIWSVTGNFGSGGGMSQTGLLTTGPNACGMLQVTASSMGESATREVRVSDGGQWVQIDSCDTGCGYVGACTARGDIVEGKYKTSWSTRMVTCSGGKLPYGTPCMPDADCTSDFLSCSASACSGWPKQVFSGTTAACPTGVSCLVRARGIFRKYEWKCPACTGDTDSDGDAYNAVGSCTNAFDCNDADAAVSPDAMEVCDGKDNNCDGQTDEGFDNEAEMCADDIDNNCDGQVDENCCYDFDFDGHFGKSNNCPSGDDCNDVDFSTNPQALETCGNGADNNCDGEVDEGCCMDNDGDGQDGISDSCQTGNDCDDSDDSVYFGAAETCGDDADNNCDGQVDDGCCEDKDKDGYYGKSVNCSEGDDSNDKNPAIYPGATEVCDGEDNDGDGEKDEGVFGMSVTPDEVSPQKTSGNTNAEVTLTLHSPAISNGCTVNISVYPEPYSGGHDHHDALRPKGKLEPSSVKFKAGDTVKTVKYTSSEFAGIDNIRANAVGEGDKTEVEVKVKVQDLEELDGSHYDQKCKVYSCAGYKHSDFYYVEHLFKYRFNYIASIYHQKYPKDKKLIINDGSLSWGGLYDIFNTWNTPHSTHRKGTDIDIRSKDIPVKNRAEFKKIACKNLVYPYLEEPGTDNEHYHLYFRPYSIKHYEYCK